jgi:CHC2 zinc finger
LNFKHDPPTPVIAERLQPWRRVSASALVGELSDPPKQPATTAAPPPARPAQARQRLEDDGLRDVAPAVYVQALTGLVAGRDGKVSCPFHGEDSTPSLHVYADPADGWYCFGCRRGGSIFDLAAEVYGLSTRGRDFIRLRRRLRDALGAWAPDTRRGDTR